MGVASNTLNTHADLSFFDGACPAIRNRCNGRKECRFVPSAGTFQSGLSGVPLEHILLYRCSETGPLHGAWVKDGEEIFLQCTNNTRKWFKFP